MTARRLLVATGLRDELPNVGGLRERWARDVLHCPYCHGYEVHGQQLGVLGGAPGSVRYAQIVPQWSDEQHPCRTHRSEAPWTTHQASARADDLAGGLPDLTVLNLTLGDWLRPMSTVLRTFVLATVAVPVVIYGLMPQLHKIRVRLLTQRVNA